MTSMRLDGDPTKPSYSKVTIIVENDVEVTTVTVDRAKDVAIDYRKHDYTMPSLDRIPLPVEVLDVDLSFTALRIGPGKSCMTSRTVPK